MEKTTILIVEDDLIQAQRLHSTLVGQGYRVLDVVVSGEEAIRQIKTLPPDLVFMDINLEGEMDGIEAAKRIRDLVNIPVIYLTSFYDQSTFDQAKDTGPFHFLQKTAKDLDLRIAIEMALYHKNLERDLKKANREIQIRNRLVEVFLTVPDDQVFFEVLEMVRDEFDSQYGIFGYFNAQGAFVVPAMTRQIYWEQCNVPDKEIIFEKGSFKGIWGRAMAEQKILYANEGPFHIPEGHIPVTNTIAAPIIYGREVISAIHLANKSSGYNQEDARFLEMVCQTLSPILYTLLQRDRKEKERRQAEEALEQYQKKLEELVEKRTEDLFKTNEELEQEIQERRQVEESLRESEGRYRLLLNSVPDYIFSVTIQGGRPISTHHGPGCLALTGYTQEEFAADPFLWHKMILDVDKIAVPDLIKKVLAGEEVQPFEHRILHKNGSVRWIRNTTVQRFDEQRQLTGYYGLISNVTERKTAEERVRENQAMLETVFEGISEPLILVDRDLRVRMFNKAASRLYGGNYFIKGTNQCFEGDKTKRESCKTCPIPEAVLKGEDLSFQRKGFIDPERIEQVSVYPVAREDRKTGEAIIRIRDITDEIRIKEEMARADKLISLGTLVAGVAHEINNPNNYIMINAPILMEVWKSILSILDEYQQSNGDFNVAGLPYKEIEKDVPGLISGIEEGARRIMRIVKDLKEFSSQEKLLEIKPEDINSIIEKAVSLLSHKIKKATHNFRVEYGANLPPVQGDFQKLEQVIVNSCSMPWKPFPIKTRGYF